MTVRTIVTSRDAAFMVSFAGAAGLWAASIVAAHAETVFKQTNLVSDGFVPAKIINSSLINPWGISEGPNTPFWVNDNGAGVATLYSVSGSSNVAKLGLTVTIPPAPA